MFADLVEASAGIMRKHGIEVDQIRFVDHDVATGVYPDMREHRLGDRCLAGSVSGGRTPNTADTARVDTEATSTRLVLTRAWAGLVQTIRRGIRA